MSTMKYNTDRAFATLERIQARERAPEEHPKFEIKIYNDVIPFESICGAILGEWTNCLYCGDDPESRDHIVPQSMYFAAGIATKGSNPGPRVICCASCNSTAGDRFYPSLTARALAIQGYIRTKHHKLLRMAEWTEEEMLEYDRGLQGNIRSYTQARKFIEKRLIWQDTKVYLRMRRSIRDFVKTNYPSNKWLNDFVKIRKDQMKEAGNFTNNFQFDEN